LRSKDVFALYLAGFCGYAASSIVFPIIAPYSIMLGASKSVAGIIAGGFALVTSITMIPFGLLADRAGRFRITVIGMLLFVIAPFFYIISSNYIHLLFARFFHGLAMAFFVPAVNAMVVDMSPDSRRGEALGWIATFTMVGYAFGPLIGGFSAEIYGHISVFYLSGLIAAVGLISLLPVKYRGSTTHEVVKLEINPKTIAAISTPFFATFGSAAIAIYSIPLYLSEFGVETGFIGVLGMALFLSSALVRVPAGKLSDIFGRKPVIFAGLVVEASGVLLFLSSDMSMIVAGTVVTGIGMGLANPAGFALISDIVPPRMRGFAMGASSSSLQLGVFLGPAIMGTIVELSGFGYGFLFFGILTFVSAVTIFLLLKR
jgi:MFS family permease